MQSLEELYFSTAYPLNTTSFQWYENFTNGNNTNLTDSQAGNQFILPWWRQIIWTVLFAGMIAVATGGNLIVIWIVMAHKRMRTVTNYFLVNLSIADAMVSTLNVTFNYTYMLNSHWTFGNLYCKISQFIAVLTICASVFTLMAIAIDSGLIGGESIQPTYSNSTSISLQSGQAGEWRNIHNGGSIFYDIEETSSPGVDSYSRIQVSIEEKSTPRGLTTATDKSNRIFTILPSGNSEDGPITADFLDHYDITDNSVVQLPKVSKRQDGIRERLLVAETDGKGDSQFVRKIRTFEPDPASRSNGGGQVDGTTDNKYNHPMGLETTTMKRTTIFSDPKPLIEPHPSVLEAASKRLMTQGMGSRQESRIVLPEVLTPTYETISHYKDASYDTGENTRTKLLAVDLAGNTPLLVVTQKIRLIEEVSNSSEIDIGWRDRNSSSTVRPAARHPIYTNAQSIPRDVEKKLTDSNRKWNSTRRSSVDPLEEDRKETVSRDDGGGSHLMKEIERNEGNETDHWANRNSDDREISRKQSESIMEHVTKPDDRFSSSKPVEDIKRTDSNLLQILKDTLLIKAQRRNADKKLLLEIRDTVRKMNDLRNSILTVLCRGNSMTETSDQHTRPFLDHPRNYGTSPTTPSLQMPGERPNKSDPVFLNYLLRSFPDNDATDHPEHIESAYVREAIEYLFEMKEIFSLLRIPSNHHQKGLLLTPSMSHYDYPFTTNQETVLTMKWARICRTVQILWREIYRRNQALCMEEYHGYEANSQSARIVCNRDSYDYKSRRIKFIFENLPIPLEHSRIGYTFPESLMLRRRCNRIEGKEEIDALPFMDPPGLEEVAEVYGDESEVKWSMGVEAEKSSFPEAMEPFIVVTPLDFKSSYSKEVSVERSYTAHVARPPEVEVLLEAIHGAIRNDEQEASKKAIVPPCVDAMKTPLALSSFSRDERNISMNESNSTTSDSKENTLGINGNNIQNEYLDVEQRKNIKASEDLTNVIKTANSRRTTLTGSSGNEINQVFIYPNNELNKLHELTTNISDDVNINHGSDENINDNYNIHFNGNVEFPKAVRATEISKKNMAPEPEFVFMPATESRHIPVESRPVAVTIDTQMYPKVTTTTSRNNDEALSRITNINARRSGSSPITVNSPLTYDVDASDNSNEMVKRIMVSAGLSSTDDTRANLNANQGNKINVDIHVENNHNHNMENNVNSTHHTFSNKKEYLNSTDNAVHEKFSESVNSFPIGPKIRYSPTATANDIVVNEERYVNTEINQNSNVSANHNANFNQSIAGAQSVRGEAIRIALPPVLRVQGPVRSIPFNKDEAADVSFNVNTSNHRTNTNIRNNENHSVNVLRNEEDAGGILSKPITENVALRSINLNSVLHDAAATLDSGINQLVNRTAQFAINQNEMFSGETNAQRSSDVRAIYNSSLHPESSLNLEIGKNTKINTKTNKNIIPNKDQTLEIHTYLTTQASPSSGIKYRPSTNLNYDANYHQNTMANKNENTIMTGVKIPGIHERSVNTSVKPQTGNSNQFSISARNIAQFPNPKTDYIYRNSNVNKNFNDRAESNANFYTGITGDIQQVENIARPAINMIAGQTPFNTVNPADAIESPEPIIGQSLMISGAFNSVQGIAGASSNGEANSMRTPVKVLSQVLNLPAVHSGETLWAASAATANTSGTRNIQRQQHESINTEYNSNLNDNTNLEYNDNTSHNTKVETDKIPSYSQAASHGIGESSDNKVNYRRGWYELWFNSGDEGKNGWTQIWNNKGFKRFLEQRLQELRKGDTEQPKKNSTVIPMAE